MNKIITILFLLAIGVSSLNAQNTPFKFSYSSTTFAAPKLSDPFDTDNSEESPVDDEKTLDMKDIMQQIEGYKWLFSENHTSKKSSYPVEMSYELFESHPDLRISGNGIYDSEGKLKRIILLRREEPWGALRIENLEISDNNGIFSIQYGEEGKSIEDKIFKALYAYDYNHNKYGIKDNLDANTKYAIENLIGIQTKEEEFDNMRNEYYAAKDIKSHAVANNMIKGKELTEFNSFWAKISKFPTLVAPHRTKMDNDKARRWFQQIVADNKEKNLECSRISRVSDLCFNVEYTEPNSHKVVLKATVEFYQVNITKDCAEYYVWTKNPLKYNWRIKDVQVVE